MNLAERLLERVPGQVKELSVKRQLYRESFIKLRLCSAKFRQFELFARSLTIRMICNSPTLTFEYSAFRRVCTRRAHGLHSGPGDEVQRMNLN